MNRTASGAKAGLASAAILWVAVALLAESKAEAQAWIREPGHAYVNLGYRHLSSDQFFGADGKVVDSADYAQHVVGFYGEVGIIERWLMLSLESELLRHNILSRQGAVTGLGDSRVTAWTGLLEAPIRLSFGVGLGIPTGDSRPDADGGDALSEEIASVIPTGDGEWDVTFQFAAGHGVRLGTAADVFVQGLVGYALRTRGFTDQFVFRVEAGVRPVAEGWNRLLFIFRVFGSELLGSARRTSGLAGVGDGVSYTAFGPELTVDIAEGFSVAMAVDGAFRATNTPAGINWKFTLAYTY